MPIGMRIPQHADAMDIPTNALYIKGSWFNYEYVLEISIIVSILFFGVFALIGI